MKFPLQTLQFLEGLLKGDIPPGHKRSVTAENNLWSLAQFFAAYGGDGIFPPEHSPAAKTYVMQNLSRLNGTPEILLMLANMPKFCAYATSDDRPSFQFEPIAWEINELIKDYGLRLVKTQDSFNSYSDAEFEIKKDETVLVAAETIQQSLDERVLECVEDCSRMIEAQQYQKAITSCYTLVESVLKELLTKLGVTFNASEGDIRQLYTLVSEPLNLNPKGDNLENHLKAILQGLRSQVGGLYELANKASDRHTRQYNPSKHHAKLAVNASFTLCDFLLDSCEYQQKRKESSV